MENILDDLYNDKPYQEDEEFDDNNTNTNSNQKKSQSEFDMNTGQFLKNNSALNNVNS